MSILLVIGIAHFRNNIIELQNLTNNKSVSIVTIIKDVYTNQSKSSNEKVFNLEKDILRFLSGWYLDMYIILMGFPVFLNYEKNIYNLRVFKLIRLKKGNHKDPVNINKDELNYLGQYINPKNQKIRSIFIGRTNDGKYYIRYVIYYIFIVLMFITLLLATSLNFKTT